MRFRTRADLNAHQLSSFRKLATYAYRRSPYYRRVIKDRSIDLSSCSVQDFPVLTKAELIDEFDNIVTEPGITRQRIERFLSQSDDPANLLDGRYVVITTSGTSGRRNVILYSYRDFDSGMNAADQMSLPMPDLTRKIRVAFVGLCKGHFAGVAMAESLRRGDQRESFDLLTIDISRPWKSIVDALNGCDPDWLLGYSTAIRELAGRRRRGELRISPSLIQCGAESLSRQDRTEIETAFGAPVLNLYGATECLCLGYGWRHDDMTLVEDKIIFELFSEYTTVTNLFNYTVPLIRYRLDDVLSKTSLHSTDPYTHVEELVARTECNLLLDSDDGTPEYISAGQLLTMELPGVKRFRCVVANKRQITIHATFDDKPQQEKARVADDLHREFRKLLHDKGIFNIHTRVEEEPEITTNPTTGKYKLIEYA